MNNKKIIIIVVVLVLLLIIATATVMILFFKKSKLIENKKFSCLAGFTFEYPVFKNWEVKTIEKKGENECIIWFNWPGNILFAVPPNIMVSKTKELGLDYLNGIRIEGISPMDRIPSSFAKTNPQNILYDNISDPTIPPTLRFYGKDFGVRIEAYSTEEMGFGKDQVFFKKVISSFNFLP
jgi:hypothetical protein